LEAAVEAVRAAPDASELSRRLLLTLAQTHTEASTDVLTGAGSRRVWERTLHLEEQRSARYGHPACVVVIDLDGLKQENDTHGHRAGDDLLRAAATALVDGSRTTDLVARVGGDEFAILAVDTDLATGRVLVERLALALAQAGVRASLGLAERTSEHGLDATWSEADRRMYATKRRRGGSRRHPTPSGVDEGGAALG
jgi:diguanylate cyclase (GGDEF)-like protein